MRLTVSTTRAAGVATAMAAALEGHRVRLHILPDPEPRVTELVGRRTVECDGLYGEQRVALDMIVADLASALEGVELLVVVAETAGQRMVADAVRDLLGPGATILLAPGGVCGALEFSGRLRGSPAGLATIAETNGLMHLGAISESPKVTVKGVKRDLPVAFFPARADQQRQAELCAVFPSLSAVENVLGTSLSNTNTIVHGPVSILSAGRIETLGGDFPFFLQALSPGAGRLVEEVDRERVQLLRALGLPPVSGTEWFRRFYGDQGIHGDTMYELLSTFGPFQRSTAPSSLRHPYFTEDVPFGLVPLASLSRSFAEPALTMEAIIKICSIVCDQDFWASGRTAESLHLEGLAAADLMRLVEEGWPALGPVPLTGRPA